MHGDKLLIGLIAKMKTDFFSFFGEREKIKNIFYFFVAIFRNLWP